MCRGGSCWHSRLLFPIVTASPVLVPDDAFNIAVPEGRSHTVNLPLEGCDPRWPQRTAKLLKTPPVAMMTCCRVFGPGASVQAVCELPAPKRRIVLDELAVPAQKACAVRTLAPVHPMHRPLIVRSVNVVAPMTVNPLTVG